MIMELYLMPTHAYILGIILPFIKPNNTIIKSMSQDQRAKLIGKAIKFAATAFVFSVIAGLAYKLSVAEKEGRERGLAYER